MLTLDRRHLLTKGALAAAALATPRIVLAQAATERRFVFIIQRGAADGLNIIMPTGDPGFAPARGALAIPGGTKLDGMFTLHPALAEAAKMYAANEALFAHAVASPYRDRSHFDGQNVLETGGTAAYQLRDGWLNRLLTQVPRTDASAIAVSATVPVALRGKIDVASYAPSALPQASDDLLARVTQLYQADTQLHPLWSSAMATRAQTSDLTAGGGANAAATGALTAKLLTGPNSARIAMIETGGWDTHSAQTARLGAQLKGLDAMLAALKTGLGPAWSDTLVLVATEFGRTVAVNGTGGTDHGTGSAAMLLGGAVAGGRVVADWPGLSAANLYENRDLKPTLGLDTLIAGALGQHYGIDPAPLARALFPETPYASFKERLVRA
ncbi:Twin-arginine translocation pathway signal sequence domain protein [Sphingomonas antarctica]|uniref:DUF1501 domain-containing protein n=1 Tax=Sphingomonas antarctica TaxID=2040274 RepID=UPI0039E94044